MTSRNDDLAREFVLSAHGDLPKVKALLVDHPELRDVEYDWGQGGTESGIAAASHVGNREIARFLIAQGAQPTICTWGMLGEAANVAALLADDPALANARGAHGIPVLFHAAMSGNVDIAQMLYDAGCREGFNHALQGAVLFRHHDMVMWLLAYGVTDINTPDWEGKTPVERAEALGATDLVQMLTRFAASR